MLTYSDLVSSPQSASPLGLRSGDVQSIFIPFKGRKMPGKHFQKLMSVFLFQVIGVTPMPGMSSKKELFLLSRTLHAFSSIVNASGILISKRLAIHSLRKMAKSFFLSGKTFCENLIKSLERSFYFKFGPFFPTNIRY